MISQRFISGCTTRVGYRGQSKIIDGRTCNPSIKLPDLSSRSYSRIPGASESFRGPTRVPDFAVCRLLGNLGLKLGFAQANSLASSMKFTSFIHTFGPKEFERGINDRPIETDMNQASIGGDRSHPPTERDRIEDFNRRLADINRNQTPPRPLEGFSRSRLTDMDKRRPPTQNTRLFDGLRTRATDVGRNDRPFESGRDTSSMSFVRGIMKENVSNTGDGANQGPRYGLEHNADVVHIKLMRNNTFVTVTDSKGNKKTGASAGCLAEMKGGPKVSKYAAEATAEHVGRIAKSMGLKSVVMKVNGFTFFKRKKLAILSFRDGYTHSRSDQNPIVYIEDTTRKPHNGCRLRKKRRV